MRTKTAPWDYENRPVSKKAIRPYGVRVCTKCGSPVIFKASGEAYCAYHKETDYMEVPEGQYLEFVAVLESAGFMLETLRDATALLYTEDDEITSISDWLNDPRTPEERAHDAFCAEVDETYRDLRAGM